MIPQPCIDIIVPVYNAPQHVEQCINSVLRHTESNFRLIVIDDASTDTRINNYLNRLEQQRNQRIHIYRNKQNLGFVGTTNQGMALSKHDVVLLNSDTIVTPGWLDKLQRCAATDSTIGTITPF